MISTLTGALALAFAVAGLIFLRFWRDSRDRLFLFFALAFFILAVNRIGFVLAFNHQGFRRDALYWVRFVAFLLILVAIVDKNRSGKSSRQLPYIIAESAKKPAEDGG